MGVENIVLLIIGILMLIESLVVLIFPKWSISIMKGMVKSAKSLRRVGIIEVIVAFVLILIGMNI